MKAPGSNTTRAASGLTSGWDVDLSSTYRGVVDPSHCNQAGQTSVGWYASRFDDASSQLLSLFGLTTAYFRCHNRLMAPVQQEISFNHELSAGDQIEIRSCMLEIRESALRVYHEMRHIDTNETIAVSTFTEAHLDGATHRPCPLPAEIQRRQARDHANSPLRALRFSLPGQW